MVKLKQFNINDLLNLLKKTRLNKMLKGEKNTNCDTDDVNSIITFFNIVSSDKCSYDSITKGIEIIPVCFMKQLEYLFTSTFFNKLSTTHNIEDRLMEFNNVINLIINSNKCNGVLTDNNIRKYNINLPCDVKRHLTVSIEKIKYKRIL